MRMIRDGLFAPDDATTAAVRQLMEQWVDLALERAAGHLQSPADVGLPDDPESLEVGLHAWLRELPAGDQRRLGDYFAPRRRESAPQRQGRLGRLARVDFGSRGDVASQLLGIGVLDDLTPSPAFAARLQQWGAASAATTRQHGSGEDGSGGSSVGPRPQKRVPQVQLCLRSLECLNDTRELGRDEMFVMGTASDGLSVLRKLEPVSLGKFRASFDDADREARHERRDERREDRRERLDAHHQSRELRGKSDDNETFIHRDYLQPFPIASFPTIDVDLPLRSFDVVLMLFEKDLGPGAAAKVLDKLLEKGGSSLTSLVYDKLKKYLVGSLGMGAGGFSAALTVAILGGMTLTEALAAVAAPAVIAGLAAMAVYAVFAAIRKALAIEAFELVHANIILSDLHGLIDEDFVSDTVSTEVAQVAPLAGRAGRYRLAYEWRVLP